MDNQKRILLAFASLLFGVGLGFLALRPMLKSNPAGPRSGPSRYRPGATPPPVPEVPGGPIVSMPTPETGGPATTVTIYTLKSDENGTTLVPRQVAVDDTLSDVDRARQAIESMAREKDSPLPKGTKALSITFASDLATVDLSPEFKSNFSGGDKAELLAVSAVTAAMGQFSKIKRVQIKIGGEIVDSLGGAQSISEPLPVPVQEEGEREKGKG